MFFFQTKNNRQNKTFPNKELNYFILAYTVHWYFGIDRCILQTLPLKGEIMTALRPCFSRYSIFNNFQGWWLSTQSLLDVTQKMLESLEAKRKFVVELEPYIYKLDIEFFKWYNIDFGNL